MKIYFIPILTGLACFALGCWRCRRLSCSDRELLNVSLLRAQSIVKRLKAVATKLKALDAATPAR